MYRTCVPLPTAICTPCVTLICLPSLVLDAHSPLQWPFHRCGDVVSYITADRWLCVVCAGGHHHRRHHGHRHGKGRPRLADCGLRRSRNARIHAGPAARRRMGTVESWQIRSSTGACSGALAAIGARVGHPHSGASEALARVFMRACSPCRTGLLHYRNAARDRVGTLCGWKGGRNVDCCTRIAVGSHYYSYTDRICVCYGLGRSLRASARKSPRGLRLHGASSQGYGAVGPRHAS